MQRVVVEVTDDCNNACLHCYNLGRRGRCGAGGAEGLSRECLRGIIRGIKHDAPLQQVALSGGEPFLRDDLAGIVSDLAEEGLAPVVITNGTLLSASRLRRVPKNTLFEVTLFSADAGLHNRIAGRRVFRRVLEGLARVERHKCAWVLAFVVTRLNAHDTARTIELGIALGASAVMLNRVNLSRRAMPIARRIVPPALLLRESLAAADRAASTYGISIAVSVPVPPCVVDPREFSHLHFGWCPRGGNEAYYTIGATGLVRPCNHSSVILGDLRIMRFGDIVRGSKARGFWKPVPRECLQCSHPLRESCRGGCPAAADECYGTREQPDPFVKFARG